MFVHFFLNTSESFFRRGHSTLRQHTVVPTDSSIRCGLGHEGLQISRTAVASKIPEVRSRWGKIVKLVPALLL